MKKEKIIPDEIALITGNNKRIYNSRRRTVSSLIKEAFTIIFEKEEMANLKIESFMFRIYKNKDIKPFLHKLVAPVGHDNLKDFKTITLQENRSSNTFVALKPLEQAVVDSICKTHKVLINEIRTKRKPREYVDARYQIFHILNRICGYKLVDIGLIFNKNHASIISGLKNHQSFVFFEKKYTRLYVESLIDFYHKPIDKELKNQIRRELRDFKLKEFIPADSKLYEEIN